MLKLFPAFDHLLNLLSPQIQSAVPLVAGALGGIGALGTIASKIAPIATGIAGVAGAAAPIAPLVTGAIQGIQAIGARKRAEGAEPSLVDVQQVRALAETRRRRRTFETGTAITPFIRPIREIQSQATLGALRAGAGQSGILRAQRLAGTQISDLITRGQQRAQQLSEQEMRQQGLISRRALGGIGALGTIASKIAPIATGIAGVAGAAAPIAPLVTGAIQGIQAIGARKRAEGAEPSLVDVQQVRALAETRRRRRTFETGTAITPFIRPIREIQSQATLGALRAGAGQSGILRAQRLAGTQISDLITRGQQRAQQLSEQEMRQQGLISRRALDLQTFRQDREAARAAQLAQSGLSNLLTATQVNRQAGQPPFAQNLTGISTPFPLR